MKRTLMITAFLCLLSAFAYAQSYTTLTVNNNTPCVVYIVVGGNVSGSACPTAYVSNVIGFPSGSTTFDAGNITGGMKCSTCSPTSLSSGDNFNFVDIATSNPVGMNMCAVINAYTLDVCGGTTSLTGINFEDWNGSTCSPCGTYDVILNGSGSTLTLDIQ